MDHVLGRVAAEERMSVEMEMRGVDLGKAVVVQLAGERGVVCMIKVEREESPPKSRGINNNHGGTSLIPANDMVCLGIIDHGMGGSHKGSWLGPISLSPSLPYPRP